jgi:hypothetical protein
MGDFKDFDLDLKKVKNSTNSIEANVITLSILCEQSVKFCPTNLIECSSVCSYNCETKH